MTMMFRTFLAVLLTLSARGAFAQYQATPQAGVSYPTLSTPQPVPLVAPGSIDARDRGRANVALGFDFPFYNNVYSRVTVTANGLLFLVPSSASNTASDFGANVGIPSGAEPNGVIAPLWDDLIGNNPTSALRSQAVTGPNGQGIALEFKEWNRSFSAFTLTFQVRLWANGTIEFFYGAMTGAGSTITATIGIESPTGTAGTRGLTNCGSDCGLASFDPSMTGTPVNYIRFGPQAGVDLQALMLRVDGITQAGADLSVSTSLTMRNFGTLPSGSFTYGVFLSEDTIFDLTDLPLSPAPPGPFSLAPLAVATSQHVGSAARPDGGSWYVLAAIPPLPDGGETNTLNNVLASSVAYAGGVDLVAESVRPPPVAGPGDVVNVDVAFSNQGFESAGSVGVKLYASLDPLHSADDRLLMAQSLNVMGGQQVSQALSFTLPGSTPADDYFVLLQLDDGPDAGVIPERSELNNFVASPGKMQVRQADLTVTAVRVLRAAAPYDELEAVFLGEPVRLEAFVSNVGGASAPNVRVAFFMSDNESLNAVTDPLVGTVTALSFAAGESRWVPLVGASVPRVGTSGQPLIVQPYFFFAAATGVGLTEPNPTNNFDMSRPTVARSPAPNLLAVEMQTPSRAGAGELVAVSRAFVNLGNRDCPTSKYRFYLSANTIITPDDAPMKRVTSSGELLDGTVTLAVGERDSMVEILRMPSTLTAAQYYIGVLLDPDGAIVEADESDNGLAGTRTVVVAQSLSVTTPFLPDGIVGVAYSVQLEGQGSVGPYSFRLVTPASLPAGLALSPSGLLSGRPTQSGSFTVLIEVQGGGQAALVARPLRVSNLTSSLQLRSQALPAPTRLVPYRATLGTIGGAGGYRYQLISGILPLGLSLTEPGELLGTPTDAAETTRTFTIRVTDAIGNIDEGTFVVTVVDAAPFTIRTRALADGELGTEYLQSIVVVNPGGAAVSEPVSWSVAAGELPPGLLLEPSRSDTVVISGTPSRPGRYRFTVEAVDRQSRADGSTYLVTISAPAVRASARGTTLVRPGGEVSVVFTAAPLPSGMKWFWRDGRLPAGITFAADGTVTGVVPTEGAEGTYSFTVGVGLAADQLLSMASWSLEVSSEKPRRAGCSATEGGFALWVLGLVWAARRRRI